MAVEIFCWTENGRALGVQEFIKHATLNDVTLFVVRDLKTWKDFTLISDGEIHNGDHLAGFQSDGRDATAISAALVHKHQVRLDEFYSANSFGTCVLRVDFGPQWEDDDQKLAFEQAYGKEYANYRDRCRVAYTTRTRLGSNEESVSLQIYVIERILELRGGLYEEPQGGHVGFVNPPVA